MSGLIFISYRRDDSLGSAGRLYDRLLGYFSSENLFMDVDTIEPGQDFVKVLERAVNSCDVAIAIIGPRWLDITDEKGNRRLDLPEDFVRLELLAALSGDIRVIPVLVQGAAMPRSSDLPDELKPLARRNAIEIRHTSFNVDTDKLIRVLKKILDEAEKKRKIEAERIAAEKAEKERIEQERKEAEQLAAVKAELEKKELIRAEAERIARENAKAEQERLSRIATIKRSEFPQRISKILTNPIFWGALIGSLVLLIIIIGSIQNTLQLLPLASKTVTTEYIAQPTFENLPSTMTLDPPSLSAATSLATAVKAVHTQSPGLVAFTETPNEQAVIEIRSFSAPPGTQPSGLAWDGRYLWMSSYMKNGGIYQIDSFDGSVRNVCTPPAAQYEGYGGLAFDGNFLWEADSYGGGIYKLNTEDCSIVTSILSPDDYPSDLAWDGSFLWVGGYPSNKIYKMETVSGSVIAEFDIPSQFVLDQNWGLSFSDGFLWLSAIGGLVKIDPSNGQVLDYWQFEYSRPQNLAWNGENLWMASFDEAMIYYLQIK